ncbi:MAG: hypothetical protein KGI49_01810 [Patescibacteria group bacterium]|nr:hypothetical protein [Patescibacteria group bacterium]
MSGGVEFDEDRASYGGLKRPNFAGQAGGYGDSSAGPDGSGMVGWLKRHGLAGSSSAAQGILIAVVIINIIITYIVVKYFLL